MRKWANLSLFSPSKTENLILLTSNLEMTQFVIVFANQHLPKIEKEVLSLELVSVFQSLQHWALENLFCEVIESIEGFGKTP